jgi:hypothetical protein
MHIATTEIAPDKNCGSTRIRRSLVRVGRRVSEGPEGLRGVQVCVWVLQRSRLKRWYVGFGAEGSNGGSAEFDGGWER